MKIQDNYPEGNILWFNDFYLNDNRMFFSAGNFNGLFEYLINEKKLYFLGNFKNEGLLNMQLYGKIHKYKNKLIFTPMSADNIAVYDIKEKTFSAIHLPLPKIPCGFEGKFLNSVVVEDKIIMFPGRFYCIVEYNINSEELQIHDEWYDECIKRWGKRSYLLFSYDMVKIGNDIFLPSALTSGIFKYCLTENKYEFIDIPYKCKCLSTLAYDGEYFWSVTDDGKLLILKNNGLILKKIDVYITYGERGLVHRSVYDNGYIWLFFSQQSKIIKIKCYDCENEYEVIKYSEKEKEYTNLEYHAVDFVEKKKSDIFFMSRSSRDLKYIRNDKLNNYINYIIDTSGYCEKEVKGIDLYRANIEYANKINLYFHTQNNVILYEKTVFKDTLEFLLRETSRRIDMIENGVCLNFGKKIYQSIINDNILS